ncbi:hypothetical protein HY339_00640 [Candidatus Gottesmanbacteria bacterium]|nr:hypothetical protein [Candidatus Gottesmanbacteria bacterium]
MMHTIILTSADHCYANALLGLLIRGRVFEGQRVLVMEQYGLMPGKTKLEGLVRYLGVSGVAYVCWQIAKQNLFVFMRFLRAIQGKQRSVYYPYWKLPGATLKRMICPRLSSPEAIAFIKKQKPDLILSLFSKDVIPKEIFSLPSRGCVNLHPAPLPLYRGISPTFWILARGEITAGVTLHMVDKGLDTGAIIAQRLFSTKGFTDEHALYMQATRYGARLVEDFVKGALNGKRPRLTPNPAQGSYFRLPTREAVRDFFARGARFFAWRDFFYQ